MKLSLILRSVTATWVAVLVGAATSFFLTPYILHRLGDEAYGLWVLVVALSDYYLYLQVGVRSAIVRFVSRNLALHKTETVNQTIATSFYFFMGIFTIVACIAFSLEHHVSSFFSVRPVDAAAFASLFLLVGIAQAFDFPLSVFEGALEAVGRFDQLYSFRIVGLLLRVALIVAVLTHGGGLFGVGAATVLSTLVLRFLAVPLAYREVDGFSLHPRGINKDMFKQMLGYGITSYSVGMGDRLKNSLYPIVLAKFVSPIAVTMYSLPFKLLNVPLNGISTMTEFVNPLSSQLEAHQDNAGLRRLLILCGESAYILFAPLAVLMIVLGKQMITLWVGNSYASTYPLLVLLTIGLGVSTTQASTQSLLFGIGRHKGLIWMRLTEALGAAAFGVALLHPWGLWGYAFATMVTCLAINMVMVPRYACKILEMPLSRYLAKGCLKPCMFSLPLAVALVEFNHVFPVKTWIGVIAGIVLAGAVYGLTLLAGAISNMRYRTAWSSMSILNLLQKRFLEGKIDLDLAANTAVLNEFEKAEEQSVAE